MRTRDREEEAIRIPQTKYSWTVRRRDWLRFQVSPSGLRACGKVVRDLVCADLKRETLAFLALGTLGAGVLAEEKSD